MSLNFTYIWYDLIKDQYEDNPLKLSDILSKLRSLEAADDTRKNQVKEY